MPIQSAYKTGTAQVTAGSAIVNGNGTGWGIALVNGGMFTRNGLAIPIASVQSDTRLTLEYAAPAGMAGSGVYAIDLGRAEAASAIIANRRLADFLAQLASMSALGAELTEAETAAAMRAILGAQAALGYTPVRAQQLNGAATNQLRQWWDGARLMAGVDGTTIGRIWTDGEAARNFASDSYQVFPGGLIIQAGASGGGDRDIIFPTAFPNVCVAVIPTAFFSQGITNGTTSVFFSALTRTAFTVRPRYVDNGGGVGPTTAFITNWIAFGY